MHAIIHLQHEERFRGVNLLSKPPQCTVDHLHVHVWEVLTADQEADSEGGRTACAYCMHTA